MEGVNKKAPNSPEKIADLQNRIKLYTQEVEPILVKHGIILGTRVFVRPDGTLGADLLYYDREEYLAQVEKVNEAQEGGNSVDVEE